MWISRTRTHTRERERETERRRETERQRGRESAAERERQRERRGLEGEVAVIQAHFPGPRVRFQHHLASACELKHVIALTKLTKSGPMSQLWESSRLCMVPYHFFFCKYGISMFRQCLNSKAAACHLVCDYFFSLALHPYVYMYR